MAFLKDQFAYRPSRSEGTNGQFAQWASFVSSPANEVALPLSWETLAQVSFAVKFNKQYQMNYQYPVFNSNLKKLEGRVFYISGYIIPLDINEGLYAVSRNPYSACYFCGKSGPESVVSLKFKTKPRRIGLDKYKTMKGTLKLNDSNPMDFIYIFTGVEEMEKPAGD